MTSLFDSRIFNERLFFPMPSDTPPPEGARDLDVPVPGGSLQVRIFPGKAPVTALLFPGNGEKPEDYDRFHETYAQAGCRLAVMGYRSYGRSRGTATLRTTLDDAVAAFRALAEAVEGPLVALGRSLGTSCAAHLAAQDLPRLKGIIWECGFVDLFALIGRRGMEVPLSLPEADLEAFDPTRKLARHPRPFLALHGTDDEVISAREGQWAFEAAAGTDKRLVLIEGGHHNDLLGRPEYWEALAAFLASVPEPVG